jgi:hypothetical protein
VRKDVCVCRQKEEKEARAWDLEAREETEVLECRQWVELVTDETPAWEP